MIHLSFSNIQTLEQMHFSAVKNYCSEIMHPNSLEDFYKKVIALHGFDSFHQEYVEGESGFEWLRRFILADHNTLSIWVKEQADKLKFDQMKKLYLNRFSKSPDIFVDNHGSYNSYTLFRTMGIKVCPYCEHEFLNEVQIAGHSRRTIEFDHFFPKGENEYPGLAMCLYNLIPSCKPCNQLKMTQPVEASPYDPNIERLSHLCPELEIGVNMETVNEQDCKISLHPSGGMIINNRTLALEQRYESITSDVYRLLRKKQQYPDEKLEELERLGFGKIKQLKQDLFGLPRYMAKGKELHTKMKEDLIGY